MSIELITIMLFSSLILLLLLGLPLVFALGGVAVIFGIFLWGPESIALIPMRAFGLMSTIVMLALPLFIFMANILQHSGVADDLYDAMHRLFGGLNGGLAIGTILICTIFAAMSGISGAATVTMGLIALPAMLERGYDKRLAMGCVMAGGALGPLIPPSVIMIVYADFAEVSVGRLFAGGVFPGLVLSVMFCIYVAVRCFFRPNLGPAIAKAERASVKEKLASVKAVILPTLLIVGVLGVIFTGVATPTEAAAVGAFGSLICAVIYRRLSWQMFKEASLLTLRVSCMVLFIVFAAKAFASVYTGIGAPELIKHAMSSMPGGKWGIIICIQAIWIFLGCLLDSIGILVITGPIFIPIVKMLGFDPIWFGVIFVVNMEMGFLTPPFGFNLFYMKGVAPEGITMGHIYNSVLPFILLQLTGLILVMVFPEIVTWLPGVIFD